MQRHHRFFLQSMRWPTLAFVVLAGLCAVTTLDTLIARTFFFDSATGQWMGAHNWWINQFLHTGGRWTMRLVSIAALAVWAATFIDSRLRQLRRVSGFLSLGMIGAVTLIGALKTITNVDCPWDLAGFGGNYPIVALFADRPDALRAGQCFPSAHASSGYALMACYFVLLERHRQGARACLALALVTGTVFGLAQQARGAHFFSHDVWSAFLVWTWLIALYAYGYRQRIVTHPVFVTSAQTMTLPTVSTLATVRPR